MQERRDRKIWGCKRRRIQWEEEKRKGTGRKKGRIDVKGAEKRWRTMGRDRKYLEVRDAG